MVSVAALLQKEVQQFITEHEHADSRNIALNQKEIAGVAAAVLAAQIAARKKTQSKIPIYYQTSNIIYPPSLNLEQSSSQATALFKAHLVKSLFPGKEIQLADLTGGFGIDSFFLSKSCHSLWHVEPNKALQEIAEHNHKQLGAATIQYVNSTAEEFLKSNTLAFDLLYIDPSRRKENQRVHNLSDCIPNVPDLQKTLIEQAEYLFIKTSPLLDIHAVLKTISFVKAVFVVAVENECKEVLYLSQRNFSGPPLIEAIDLTSEGVVKNSFPFTFEQESETIPEFSDPLTYLCEPNAAVLKAGAFKSIAHTFDLLKIHRNTHLYTSSLPVKDFPGRVFRIEQLVRADVKELHALLPDQKVNVITRNYPLSAEQLKNKLKLKDGGEKYLIAFSTEHKKMVLLCSRLK
jgi:hypothetical protein